jgi:predicted nuclease with TOPRIM domain|tara:strand:- start:948 stop:1193 length:246 start_codon:yes stop_codon:yes gene_type:complete
MAKNEVQDIRLNNIETKVDRHELLLDKLADNQLELSTRLTELTSSMEVQNQLIGEGFDLIKKVIIGLTSCLSAILVGTQVM